MAHISHLIEDRDITFDDIASIAFQIQHGTLQGATQKLDGANLMYSCTSKMQTRAARSEGDIKSGGMIGALLEAKFEGRGLVQDTFATGFETLRRSVLCLTLREVAKVFENVRLWYSAEIIYTKNRNVVTYEGNTLVLHERPVLCFDGQSVVEYDNEGFKSIEAGIHDMNESSKQFDWRVRGPQRIDLHKMTDDVALQKLLSVVSRMGRPEVTLQSWLINRARDDLKAYGMSEPMLEAASLRLSEAKGAPSLTVLRARVPFSVAAKLRTSDEWVTRQLTTLDFALFDFAVAALSNVKPSLIVDPDMETTRIREQLKEALVRVTRSRNQHAIDYANLHMQKLKDVSRINTPLEGIVFPWKNKIYKLTGAFAPTNAILGLCRYGRGKAIPPIT